ncbi:MAG: hypothetical protein M3Y87_00680 [Myxococcota bacterium]|nr:hypothetical protein [Myxococcota bacterium]
MRSWVAIALLAAGCSADALPSEAVVAWRAVVAPPRFADIVIVLDAPEGSSARAIAAAELAGIAARVTAGATYPQPYLADDVRFVIAGAGCGLEVPSACGALEATDPIVLEWRRWALDRDDEALIAAVQCVVAHAQPRCDDAHAIDALAALADPATGSVRSRHHLLLAVVTERDDASLSDVAAVARALSDSRAIPTSEWNELVLFGIDSDVAGAPRWSALLSELRPIFRTQTIAGCTLDVGCGFALTTRRTIEMAQALPVLRRDAEGRVDCELRERAIEGAVIGSCGEVSHLGRTPVDERGDLCAVPQGEGGWRSTAFSTLAFARGVEPVPGVQLELVCAASAGSCASDADCGDLASSGCERATGTCRRRCPSEGSCFDVGERCDHGVGLCLPT